MPDTLDRLNALKAQVEVEKSKLAKRQADADLIESRLRDNLEQLKQLGISSIEDGRKRLQSIDEELDAALEQAERILVGKESE